MNNGKHVTVEKPMTQESLEAIKLADFSHENQGLVGCRVHKGKHR